MHKFANGMPNASISNICAARRAVRLIGTCETAAKTIARTAEREHYREQTKCFRARIAYIYWVYPCMAQVHFQFEDEIKSSNKYASLCAVRALKAEQPNNLKINRWLGPALRPLLRLQVNYVCVSSDHFDRVAIYGVATRTHAHAHRLIHFD